MALKYSDLIFSCVPSMACPAFRSRYIPFICESQS